MYGSWGPTIGDGWFGWPNHDLDVPITGLDWVEAIGQRNTPWEGIVSGDGVMKIKIKKSELGNSFHWAASPTVGSGFWPPHGNDVTMQIPTAFGWATPLVNMSVPNYVYAGSVKGEYPKWITSGTDILMSAFDPEPHPSGLASLEYRITLMGSNEPCESTVACQQADGSGAWAPVTGIVNIPEESCHLIEIVATDNVDKISEHKQCVFVDNTPPTPIKTVDEPKDIWTPGKNGDEPSYFYGPDNPFDHPDITELCWNGQEDSIDCWEVTQLTPITMNCVDPDPHPVDHESVCFQVELDGVDKTEEYCDSYCDFRGCHDGYGEFDETTGYCCTDKVVEDFYFREDTEHNLKYYCVDALGNTNEELDEEKFKVRGTKFEIPLYKKWNLISVPFQLLSSAPQDVFTEDKGITGVDGVWTYDPNNDICPTEWCVYTPDAPPEASNLTSIEPGWGYWVMETNEEPEEGDPENIFGNAPAEVLTLGGSLFKTGPSAPPSRELSPGWNLVGYYGSDWQTYPLSDLSFVCGDAFEIPDRYIYGDQVYCSLNSLVDTQEGYPKWSSLMSYINCGDHKDAWFGLNTCVDGPGSCMDRMYAGRGYWVEMDIADLYAPATTCIWNDDFRCVSPFGGPQP